MAQLGSPGVAVTVIDESFYTPAAPGTTPLIIVATDQDKANSAGTGTAPGTLKANAGKVYLMTSQMDLGTTFGTPYFETDASNNPVHAGERNEYGLQAAYSYLGVSSRAYVVRADVDLGALAPQTTEPSGTPNNETYWFDTADSLFGIFEWNGAPLTASSISAQAFTNKVPAVITSTDFVDGGTGAPLKSFGAIGSYAIVTTGANNVYQLFYKNSAGNWVVVGSNEWTQSWPTVDGTAPQAIISGDSFTLAASPVAAQTITATTTIAGTTLTVTSTDATSDELRGTGFTITAGSIISFANSVGGLSANTRYYVVGTPTSTAFQVATTASGSVEPLASSGPITEVGRITTTATNVITATGASNKLTTNETVVFSGTPFGGVSTGVTYYVVQVTGDNFSVSLTNGGAPIAITGASGTMSGACGEATLTVTGNTSVDEIVADITGNIAGITAAKGIDGQLIIYTNGTVNKVTLNGAGLSKLGIASGPYYAPALQISGHTQVPGFKSTDTYPRPTGSVWVKATDANLGANWTVYSYNTVASSFKQINAPLYSGPAAALAGLDSVGGGARLAQGATYVKFNDEEYTFWESNANTTLSGTRSSPAVASFKLYTRANTGATTVTTKIIGASGAQVNFVAGNYSFAMVESIAGASAFSSAKTITFAAVGTAADATTLAGAINSAGFVNILASVTTDKKVQISHRLGGDIRFDDSTGSPLQALFGTPDGVTVANLYTANPGDTTFGAGATWGVASNWKPTASVNDYGLTANATPPSTTTANGQLWYNSSVSDVDVMVKGDSGWVGYKTAFPATRISGPFITATQPTTGMVDNDLWIDTSDLENYPKIYRYNSVTMKWALLDNSDQTSESGILFQDARWSTAGADSAAATIEQLLTSSYVDGDAPDPALYPKGMLLWNTRRSSFNVKEFKRNFVDLTARNPRQNNASQAGYYPHRWVSIAANQENGAGTFGRKAQRAVVVQALQGMLNTNQAIRDEDSIIYNLIACPGYPEAVGEMVNLNYDRSLASFIVADTPARLKSDATSLSNWGNNANSSTDNSDNGLVTADPYVAFYYPWGYSSDNLGNNIVVPPSHMMLRTIALSDNVSYPWFAPAGTRRGGITNATAVGYVDSTTGEFNSVALNTGQRDTLASVHVNPITFISGSGLVAYGQYTRQLAASSLDRVNVARLIVYLRRQFTQLAKPYVFEPNDTITRNEIKQAAESLLLELVGQRAIYDYLVVCDSSNNTPARIDRSELYLDVAIEPVKAAEFIYIPLRLENTGAIKGLGQ